MGSFVKFIKSQCNFYFDRRFLHANFLMCIFFSLYCIVLFRSFSSASRTLSIIVRNYTVILLARNFAIDAIFNCHFLHIFSRPSYFNHRFLLLYIIVRRIKCFLFFLFVLDFAKKISRGH